MEKGKRKGISLLTRSGGGGEFRPSRGTRAAGSPAWPASADGAVGVGPRASEEGERR
jgi:hypothetical protein